jgi:hypothetical protein
MPEFILDSEGEVLGQAFDDLHPFTRGYIEAMFFTENSPCYSMVEWFDDDAQEALREGTADGSIPGDAGFGDIDPDSMIVIHADCLAFRRNNSRWLSMAYARDYDEMQAGRDFWFTRNGHGAGFWDRKELEADDLGQKLSDACSHYGEVYVSFERNDESPTGYGYVTC